MPAFVLGIDLTSRVADDTPEIVREGEALAKARAEAKNSSAVNRSASTQIARLVSATRAEGVAAVHRSRGTASLLAGLFGANIS